MSQVGLDSRQLDLKGFQRDTGPLAVSVFLERHHSGRVTANSRGWLSKLAREEAVRLDGVDGGEGPA